MEIISSSLKSYYLGIFSSTANMNKFFLCSIWKANIKKCYKKLTILSSPAWKFVLPFGISAMVMQQPNHSKYYVRFDHFSLSSFKWDCYIHLLWLSHPTQVFYKMLMNDVLFLFTLKLCMCVCVCFFLFLPLLIYLFVYSPKILFQVFVRCQYIELYHLLRIWLRSVFTNASNVNVDTYSFFIEARIYSRYCFIFHHWLSSDTLFAWK